MEYAGGMKLLDLMPSGYSDSYVRQLFDALGEEGRRAYLTRQLPVDMVYPLLFAISYSFLLSFIMRKTFDPTHWIHWLSLLPVVAGLFDYLENCGIIIMLSSYPDFSSGLVSLTAVFSVIKASVTTLAGILLIIVSAVFGFKRMV